MAIAERGAEMFIWWGSTNRTRSLESGYFECPRCQSRQPCGLFRIERVRTVYSIPLGGGDETARYVECRTCRTQFESTLFSGGSQAGKEEFQVVTWSCPKCDNANPNSSYRCLKCGVSLV